MFIPIPYNIDKGKRKILASISCNVVEFGIYLLVFKKLAKISVCLHTEQYPLSINSFVIWQRISTNRHNYACTALILNKKMCKSFLFYISLLVRYDKK